MRLLLAMFKHETNTFSPLVTDLARFAEWSLHWGEDARAAYADTRMPLAALASCSDNSESLAS